MFAGFLLKWELKRKSYVKVVVVSAEVVHRIGLPERPVDHLEQCVSQSLFPLESKYNHSTINQFIRDWYCYASYLNLDFINKENLFEKLYNLEFRLDSFGETNDKFISLIKEYNLYSKNQIKFNPHVS